MFLKSILKISHRFILPVLFSWFLLTLFIDMIAVPTVFSEVSNRLEAGNLGMAIFSAFNNFEFFLAILFILGSVACYQKTKNRLPLFFSIVLFGWVFAYKIIFIPKIIYFTSRLHAVLPNDPMLESYQSSHAFYHHLYRYLDIIKSIIIFIFVCYFGSLKTTEDK